MARPKGQPKLGGRQKGTPNKTTVVMKEAIMSVYADLQEEAGESHGHFKQWAKDNSTEFYKIAAKLIPQDINANVQAKLLPGSVDDFV
jgi:hypothetical protein